MMLLLPRPSWLTRLRLLASPPLPFGLPSRIPKIDPLDPYTCISCLTATTRSEVSETHRVTGFTDEGLPIVEIKTVTRVAICDECAEEAPMTGLKVEPGKWHHMRRPLADRPAALKETSEAPAAQQSGGIVNIRLRCGVCGAPATIIQEERTPGTGEARYIFRTGWCDKHFPGVEGGKD